MDLMMDLQLHCIFSVVDEMQLFVHPPPATGKVLTEMVMDRIGNEGHLL